MAKDATPAEILAREIDRSPLVPRGTPDIVPLLRETAPILPRSTVATAVDWLAKGNDEPQAAPSLLADASKQVDQASPAQPASSAPGVGEKPSAEKFLSGKEPAVPPETPNIGKIVTPEILPLSEGYTASILADDESATVNYIDPTTGDYVGTLEAARLPNGKMAVENHSLADDARGRGLGQKVIEHLGKKYGEILSDQYPSEAASEMWRRLGAKKKKITIEEDEQYRYVYKPQTEGVPSEENALKENVKNELPGQPEKAGQVQQPEVPSDKIQLAGEITPKLAPNDLRPALKLKNGAVIPGEPGVKHNDIIASEAKKGNADVVDEPEHGFVDKQGNFMSRRQAADAIGEKDDLHSERLREVQDKPLVSDEAYARMRAVNKSMEGKPDQAVVNVPISKRRVSKIFKSTVTPEPPAKVEQKMQAAVDQAPKNPTTSMPSQKEAKSELVARLEKAVADAPETGGQKITIEIPGDGTFTIWNTKENLQNVLKRAKSLDTSSTKPASVSRSGISKADKEEVAKILANPQPVPESPEIIGMGGATPGEFEHSAQTPTGIKNATVDTERAKRGLPAAVQPARKSFGEVWDRAMAKVDQDPGYQDRLIDELRDNPRALTDEEDAVLLQRQIDLQNEYGKATRSLAQNHSDGFEVGIESDRLRVAELSDQLLDLYNINKRAGTETGRGLAARRMMANEDFSLAQMELGKRAAKGGERLTEKEREQLTKLHDEIESWQKRYDDHVAAAKQREANLEFQIAAEKLKASAKPIEPGVQRIIDRIGATLHTQADAARARIRARAGKLSAGVDPTVLADVAIIGAQHIFDGAVDFAEWSKKMVEDLGEQIKPHLQEFFDASNKEFDKVTDRTALDKAQAVNQRIRKMTAPQRIEYTTGKIADKLKKGKKDEVTSLVQTLARSFVEQYPNIEREGLIDFVHQALQKIDPNISRSDARDMISGYGEFRQLSKDQISIKLRDLKGQMQQVAKLEAMQKGEPPVKTGMERRTPSIEESKLIKAVNEAKREFQIPITDPNTQLKSSLDTLKARLTTSIRDYEEKLANGDFTTKPKKEIKLDSEALRLKGEAEKAKGRYLAGLRADRLRNRTPTQKALDTMVKWSRGFLLSGPSTLAKLTSAAFWRMASNPLEEGIGSGLKKLPYVSQVAARAPIEGRGFNVKHEAAALTQGFMQGLRDAEQTMRTGKSALDRVFGGRQDSGIGELDDEQKSVVDFFGHLHGALKAPVKRAAFERAFQQQAEFYTEKGIDVSDPAIQTKMAVEAYKRANKDIFMQPNRYADRVRRFINSLEEKSKVTGDTPASAKLAASAARVIMPIVRVPTNIVGEAIEYSTGLVTGSAKTAQAFRAGIDQLKPEQADQIMRELKKGSIGGAALLLGYFLPQFVGGFYQQGEKRPKDDVKYGGIRLFGHDVPKLILHTPLIETVQLGATVARVADSKLRKKDLEKQGISAGALAGALGLADDVPFIQESTQLSRLMNPHERSQWIGELAKSRLVPQMISQTAEYFDKDAAGRPIQRKPSTAVQYIESGIPGLRQNVPVKRGK